MKTQNARDTLAAVHRSEVTFSRLARWPLRRHAAFGLLEAMIIFALATPMEVAAVVMVAAGLMGWLVIQGDRKRDGFFVHGYSSQRALPATIAAAMIAGAAVIALILADALLRWSLIGFVVAAIVFVGCTLASIWWEKLFQKELREAAKS